MFVEPSVEILEIDFLSNEDSDARAANLSVVFLRQERTFEEIGYECLDLSLIVTNCWLMFRSHMTKRTETRTIFSLNGRKFGLPRFKELLLDSVSRIWRNHTSKQYVVAEIEGLPNFDFYRFKWCG